MRGVIAVIQLIAVIISGVIMWHVIMASAPQWITWWWIAYLLSTIGGLTQGLVKN